MSSAPLEKPWRAFARRRGAELRTRRIVAGYTQDQLATAVGTSQQTIDRLERGDVRDSAALPRIASVLNWPTAAMPDENHKDLYDNIADTIARMPRDPGAYLGTSELIPVYLQGLEKAGYIGTEQVSEIYRPHPLRGVKGAYAVMCGEYDMDPIFGAGDLLLIHPYLPPREGNEMLYRDETGRAMARTIVRLNAEEHIVRRYLPHAEHPALFADWPIRHVIVGKYSRL